MERKKTMKLMNVIDITKLECKSINQIIPFFSKIIYDLKVNFPNIKEEEFICKFRFEETKDGILRTSFQIIYSNQKAIPIITSIY